jgi:hypothetical protein
VAEIDLFANQVLEEAKRFLEKAGESADSVAEAANLHAALMLSFCSLEAHVNSICEEFSIRQDLSAHEKALLLEKEVRLEDGEFRLGSTLKMARLEDRMEFLHSKFAGKPIDRSSAWWGRLNEAAKLRNKLTHAKTVPPVTQAAVKDAILAIVQALDSLCRAIYKRGFPSAGQGLASSLSF